MHRADPFNLDEEIAEAESSPGRRTQTVEQIKRPEPAPPPHVATPSVTDSRVAPAPKPAAKRKRGRPKSNNPKRQITLRIDAEVIEHYKAKGRGWQTRINKALREAAGINRSDN